MKKIINKVTKSSLITIDLELWRPKGKRIFLDLKSWLYKKFVLREKDFRKQLKIHNWEQYKNTFVAIDCSSKAIIPNWAYMLVSIYLQNYASKIVYGSLEFLENIIYFDIIEKINIQIYKNTRVIIKSCFKNTIPKNIYLLLIQKLQPVVHSIMYGEACSTVPLFKKNC